MTKKVLIIYAHPDDEAIITGGTIINLVDRGYEVNLICATRGESSTAFDREYVTKEDLPLVREKELLDACRQLGINKTYFMDYIDGTLNDIDENEAVNRLIYYLDSEEPDIIITFEPNGVSHHKDHKTIHRWTMKAVASNKLKAYPEKIYWATESNESGRCKNGKLVGHSLKDITTIIDIKDNVKRKSQAVMCHRSQIKALEKNELLKDGRLIRRNEKEYFIRVDRTGKKMNVEENNIE